MSRETLAVIAIVLSSFSVSTSVLCVWWLVSRHYKRVENRRGWMRTVRGEVEE